MKNKALLMGAMLGGLLMSESGHPHEPKYAAAVRGSSSKRCTNSLSRKAWKKRKAKLRAVKRSRNKGRKL
jgi:hypothetical protein